MNTNEEQELMEHVRVLIDKLVKSLMNIHREIELLHLDFSLHGPCDDRYIALIKTKLNIEEKLFAIKNILLK